MTQIIRVGRVAGLLSCALVMGCAAGPPSVERTQSAVALPPPTLASHPGLLCFTTGDFDTPPATGFDGWVNATVPQSRAVLGGSGLAGGSNPATSIVQFQVTALSDSLQWGDRQEVCAEASAASACTTLLACWSGGGAGTIELSSSPQCDPSVPATRTVYATASLPPLAVGATTYEIIINWFTSNQQVNAIFMQNGSPVGSFHTTQISSFAQAGFSGYRANRVQTRTFVQGGTPSGGTYAETTSVGRVGQQFADGTELGCSYLAPPPMALALQRSTGQLGPTVKASWQNPPATTPTQYRIYSDGREFDRNGIISPYQVDPGQPALVNHRTHVQLTYVDANGNLSETADALDTAPPAPVSPLVTDGQLNVGVVMVRYGDSPKPAEGWAQRLQNMTSKIFGTAPGAYTLANYLHEASAGHLTLTGAVSTKWVTLKDSSGNVLQLANDCTGHPPNDSATWMSCHTAANTDTLTAQARAAGVPVDSYEQLVFYVAGYNGGNSSLVEGLDGLAMSDPDGLPSLSILAHELGHVLGFSHTYLAVCPGANLDGMTSGNCSTPGGARATTGFPTPFDAEVSLAWHLSDWNTLFQYQEGWLTDAQVIYANAGTPDATYTLAPLDATGTAARQMRVELDPGAFYFAEYRDGSGFQGPGPFDNRAGYPNSNPAYVSLTTELIYQSEVGVTVWLRPPRALYNYYSPDVVASSLRPGDYFCDPTRRVAIRVLSLGSTASVRVERGPCTAPSLDPVCPIDGQKDGSESGIDCGGPCRPCGMNFQCHTGSDCASGYCGPTGTCLAATCGNGIQDGTETDVDCGGVACVTCGLGKACKVDTDCQSIACRLGFGLACVSQ